MFSALSDKLEGTLQRLRGEHQLTEENVTEALREVRRAFLEADVHFTVTRDFVARVKEKALGGEVLQSISPGQMIVKIIHDELANTMGGEASQLQFQPGQLFGILMAGLQGSGKTTFTGKIALHLRTKHKRKVLMVAADVYRPAAIQQLQVLGKSLDIEVYSEGQGNPVEICRNAQKYALDNGFDTILYDTAGRLQIDDTLMLELENIKAAVKPQEILFVADAMIGQEAVNVAETFHQKLGITGACLSKLDGDTRGGAALSILQITGAPIRFVGVGERLHQIEVFHPDRMASRILGMGDVVTLVEKAQLVIDEKEAKSLTKKILNNKFDLDDFLNQLRSIKKMGPLKDILGLIPGLGKALPLDMIQDKEIGHVEAILSSMTPKERRQPKIIDGSRRKRIAAGSGQSVQKVNQILKQFEDMRKMMKSVSGMMGGGKGQKMDMAKMRRQLSQMMPGGKM